MNAIAAVARSRERASEGLPVYARDASEIVSDLRTNEKDGLDPEQVEARLAQFGPNTLDCSEAVRWHHILGRQFADALVAIFVLGSTRIAPCRACY